jgi:hypothetical protein
MMARFVQIDLESPDPTDAVNAFLWNMRKAKELGFVAPNKWMMAEHFFHGEVGLVFYSSSGGTIALAADEAALDSDDSFEVMKFVMGRVAERRKAKRQKKSESPAENSETRTLPIMPSQRGGLAREAQKADV